MRYGTNADILVLPATAAALETLSDIEDEVDAAMLAKTMQVDPLITIKEQAPAWP